MAKITLDAKMKIKRSTVTGEVPAIGPSADHTDGSWSATDIYSGELFLNETDARLWVGAGAKVKELFISDKTEIHATLGGWDMDTDSTLVAAHGLSATEWLTVRDISVMIYNDSISTSYSLLNDGEIELNSSRFTLTRGTSFDSTDFDDSGINRGTLTYTYTKD